MLKYADLFSNLRFFVDTQEPSKQFVVFKLQPISTEHATTSVTCFTITFPYKTANDRSEQARGTTIIYILFLILYYNKIKYKEKTYKCFIFEILISNNILNINNYKIYHY